ncbi:MAG TPA: CDP-alcohol phosphatidyltransferase family protein [Thermoanaerobaculaceae bacterium]|nr:CDP-alcohol phosphatidyltransferase family protein [Thermoanaerobaculaceae bacterium]HRS15225.1 CDP-alcohol phosphatidyltransferase family protein [Thermoanaerobaculaceae bacterium]
MPSVYDLKARFQALLRPLVGGMARAGVRPNHLTLGALVGSAAAGGLVLLAARRPLWLLVLPVWLFVRMALNALDGMLAREHAMVTPLGGALNEMGDVLSDLALYLPLAAVRPDAAAAAVAFGFGAVLTEMSGVLGQALGARRHYEGPMGKSDRALLVGLLAVLAVVWPRSLEGWGWVLGAAAVLSVLTCWNRLRAALAELAAGEKP